MPRKIPDYIRAMSDGQIFNTRNDGFMSCYFAAEKAIDIQPIRILWNTILSTCFPPTREKAHLIATQALPGGPDDEELDAIVFKVRRVWAANPGEFKEILGALAVWTKVQIYEWKYDCGQELLQSMRPVHPERLDLGSGKDRYQFEKAMDGVRARGWESAQFYSSMRVV
ncbi:hypothetical protein FBEOM_12601 [Fusarium beomiforme]|uniref:Uncharacterized protein n=1 Tax=Fusarium beomiforme TaxID=44412 RepID=A0A9P5A7D4_9HYPO|nr:hypothetical protein FBEOM_12601 [Fusarium beomiforme]